MWFSQCDVFFCHCQLQVSLHQVKRSEDIIAMHCLYMNLPRSFTDSDNFGGIGLLVG